MANQPTVPFWLQILTLSLAPVLGFLGVAIGVLLQSRNARILALRTHRQDVYIRFIEAALDLQHLFALHINAAFWKKDTDSVAEKLTETQSQRLNMLKLFLQVETIGSRRTVLPAQQLQAISVAYGSAIIEAAQGRYSQQEWEELANDETEAIKQFRAAASRDLGVSRWQRMRVVYKNTDFQRPWN